jgi:hypothetical protein
MVGDNSRSYIMYAKHISTIVLGLVLLLGILAYAQPSCTHASGITIKPIINQQVDAGLAQIQEIQDNLRPAGEIMEAL